MLAEAICIDNIINVFTAVDNSTCNQPKFPGPCRGMFTKYYYNKDKNSCQMFIYGGCNANANNFATKEDCEKTCVKNAGLLFCNG